VLITLLIPWDSGERISFAVTVMLSIIVFLLILSDTLPKSNQQPILSRMIMSLTFFSLFGVFFTVLISALNSYKNEKIDSEGKIDSRIVRFLYNACKLCCVFNNNSCNKSADVETGTHSRIIPRITNGNQQSTEINSSRNLDENKPLDINQQTESVLDNRNNENIQLRTESYYNATNTLNRRNVGNVVNNDNQNAENDNELKQKKILKEDCDKMITILETVYSVSFLITFVALCIVMFSSKSDTV
jgi:hypothetical protein